VDRWAHSPDDGGSTYLWNVGRHPIKNTAVHPRRFWASYSPPWELDIYITAVWKQCLGNDFTWILIMSQILNLQMYFLQRERVVFVTAVFDEHTVRAFTACQQSVLISVLCREAWECHAVEPRWRAFTFSLSAVWCHECLTTFLQPFCRR
jgi:hypothetical protein